MGEPLGLFQVRDVSALFQFDDLGGGGVAQRSISVGDAPADPLRRMRMDPSVTVTWALLAEAGGRRLCRQSHASRAAAGLERRVMLPPAPARSTPGQEHRRSMG
ncbi:MAG: hypothetical protein CMH65_03190 [Nevskiales bacterium]|nr:hypothetical protein [Nevskiales bacterium]